MTARERIEILLDEGTFVEINPFVTHRTVDFGIDKIRGTWRWCCYWLW